MNELYTALDALMAALYAKAVEFDDVVKSGRTHLQDAVPVRLGQEFGAYARAVERDAQKICLGRRQPASAWASAARPPAAA